MDRGRQCLRHRPALLDFVDHGEIVPGTANALAHLDTCDRCTNDLEMTLVAITALRRLGDDIARAEPSPDAWPRLRARLDRWRPMRWAIMSPSAGMVMSMVLVAVLLAPLRISGVTAPSAPTGPTADQRAALESERRDEAAYIQRSRKVTIVNAPAIDQPSTTFVRDVDGVRTVRKEVPTAEPTGRPLKAI